MSIDKSSKILIKFSEMPHKPREDNSHHSAVKCYVHGCASYCTQDAQDALASHGEHSSYAKIVTTSTLEHVNGMKSLWFLRRTRREKRPSCV